MKPDPTWARDWQVGLAPAREAAVSRELIGIFTAFWEAAKLDEKAKTTRSRYAAGLHALGGYLVERAASSEADVESVEKLLLEAIDTDEGPLIHHDNEAWQRELDTVCRKLHRYLRSKR